MALVKFSALISEMRNKLNGSVFARNRGGNYLRNKVTPNNPKTVAQVAARNLLATFSQKWRTLTEAQRLAWRSAVDAYKKTNVFGDVVTPSGNILFTRLNVNLSLIGQSSISVPPTPSGVEQLNEITVTADSTTPSLTIAVDPDPIPADTYAIVEATPSMSPGIYNANTAFRVVEVFDPAQISPLDITTKWGDKFGTLQAGSKLHVRVKFVNGKTGEVGLPISASAIIS